MSRKNKHQEVPSFATAGDWHNGYVPMFADMIDSPAYISLSATAKEVYLILRKQYRGQDCTVICPYSTFKKQYLIREETVSNALDQLEIFGFIEIERGGLEHKPSKYKLVGKWKELRDQEKLKEAKEEFKEISRRKRIAKENKNHVFTGAG